MKKSTYTSYEELPLVLSVPNIAGALGIALSGAYELARRESFPSFTIGSRILVPKEKFIQWLEAQSAEKPERF
ncbi:MAG: helix-turn-helix domain-containing protein [Oscillospiraceae bacterium]|jgi:hypothetical protein